ncbi:MAG: M1 family metallopeptidase [Gemmatimonadales bacterium]
MSDRRALVPPPPIVRRVAALAASVVALAAGPLAAQRLDVRPDRERTRHDALHYAVWIALADSGSRFEAAVDTRWRLDGAGPIRINLAPSYAIDSLTIDGRAARYQRAGDLIEVAVPSGATGEVTTRIRYAGAPPKFRDTDQDDGLVQRGAGATRRIFADNWPDRARQWLAAQDHPSDKATVSWTIDAPAGLTVVANGTAKPVETLADGRRRWRFAIDVPIPVYTMVLGAARLATTDLGEGGCPEKCVPVSVATYPEDSAWAVSGPFREAREMVDFFSRLFAPFPYGELRHVQSSTIFGGMENSTVIFYDENGYQQRRLGAGTVAHETAHQWFGDAATETDWHHLWLSEGFATYAAALWREHQGGDSALRAAMRGNRETVKRSPATERPIIDPAATDLMGLLNSNNYPKGSWVLHSLRGLVGDSVFFRGVRRYYREHEHKNALSSDFARIMSEEAGADLTWYFSQALTQPGYPIVKVEATLGGGHATVTLTQVQKPEWGTFQMPNLEIRVAGRTIVVPMTGREARTVFHWPEETRPKVELDPNVWWLIAEPGETGGRR